MQSKKIEVHGVSKIFNKKREEKDLIVLDHIDLDIRDGEFVSLIGASGCGKSTLLNVIAGLIEPSKGEILIDGKVSTGYNSKIGYMFQKDTLLPWATVIENVTLPMEIKGKIDQDRAREYLSLVGLSGFETHYPGEISGGMRKRVQLARLLVQNPEIILMDEPFGALDAQTKLVMQEEFLKIWEKERKTVVFVTHDLNEAIMMSDRVVLLSARPGRIREISEIRLERPRNVEDTLSNPLFIETFRHLWSGLKEEVQQSLGISNAS